MASYATEFTVSFIMIFGTLSFPVHGSATAAAAAAGPGSTDAAVHRCCVTDHEMLSAGDLAGSTRLTSQAHGMRHH